MMQPVLLKLNASEVMHVRSMPFHLLEHELHFRLSNDLLFIYSHNSRLLPEFSRPAAPTRPDAKTQAIDRQRRRRDNVNHADQRLHSVEFTTNIFAKQAALQIGKDCVVLHWQLLLFYSTQAQTKQNGSPQQDPINRKRRKAPRAHPAHEPSDHPERDNERNNQADRE